MKCMVTRASFWSGALALSLSSAASAGSYEFDCTLTGKTKGYIYQLGKDATKGTAQAEGTSTVYTTDVDWFPESIRIRFTLDRDLHIYATIDRSSLAYTSKIVTSLFNDNPKPGQCTMKEIGLGNRF